jgi:putative transposase
MLRVVKVRLYPNKKQQDLLSQHFGSSRFIYNFMLSQKIEKYKSGENISSYDLKKQLPKMKKSDNFSWLKEVDSTSLQNSVLNLDKAYQNFFRQVKKGEKAGGFPKFKSKHNSKQSYQTSKAKIKNEKLYLPKIGEIKAVFHRKVKGKIKTVTVLKDADKFFTSINFEDGKAEIFGKNNGETVGIDVGVKVFATLSNGIQITAPKLGKEITKVIKAQKRLSRRKKGGSNRIKAKNDLARKHQKVRNKRDDFLHKISKQLSENQTVIVEDLKIKSMSKSAKGTVENPNMRSSAKSGLNRSILEQSWGKFFQFLDYKLKRNGGKLVKVNPKYTSQKCSKCGYINKENRKTQSEFKCLKCGHSENADFNASKNILAVGSAV